MRMIKKHLWTSILEYPEILQSLMDEFIAKINELVSFDTDTKTTVIHASEEFGSIPFDENFFWRSDRKIDFTCVAKGWFLKNFIKFVTKTLKDLPEDFYISFGGDICTYNSSGLKISSEYQNNLKFLIKGEGNLFCSTNFKRPGHIPDAHYEVSYCFNQKDLLEGDKKATLGLVRKETTPDALVTKNKRIQNKTYIASPFFCSTDIEIRDRMLLIFDNYIRPDLLNPDIEGDLHKDESLAQKIKDDNLRSIDECSVLVFPKDTTDLGTLYEVGYAIRKGKLIVRYDYTTDEYEVIINPTINSKLHEDMVLDLNKLGSGVLLGYFYDQPIKYFLGSSKDNIMLMNNILVDFPETLYPCYLPYLLSDSVFRLNTITSGS